MMNLQEAIEWYKNNKDKADKKAPGFNSSAQSLVRQRVYCQTCNRAIAIDSNQSICEVCQKTREQARIAEIPRRGVYGRM